jgi:hypothetical protein
MPLRRVHRCIACLSLILLAGTAGCSRRAAPLDRTVSAPTGWGYLEWRSDAFGDFPADLRQDFDAAMQELRFKAMRDGAAGTDAIDASVAKEANGKTVREVLQLGLGAKLHRLEQQRALIDAMMDQNAQLITRPGDADSASFLETKRQDQVARRDAIATEIAALRARFNAWGLTPPPPPPPLPAGAGDALHAAKQPALDVPDQMPQVLQH